MTAAMLSVAEFTERLAKSGRDPDAVMRHAPAHALRALFAQEPVRTGLSRTVAERVTPVPGADGGTDDGLTIEGHWTVFNSLTEINSWEGTFTEQVLPGATKKTLRDKIPKMQFDHGHHPLLGSLPLGRWDQAKEDDRGSWSIGRMADNWLVAPFAHAIREGNVDGMSFRFSVVREKWYDAQDVQLKTDREVFELMFWEEEPDRLPLRRDLIEVGVSEAGPVVWPAYKDTNVGARSADGARMVIDLAALTAAHRRDAGYLVAQIDAEMARAESGQTPPEGDPRARWQAVGRAELARMAADQGAVAHNPGVDHATVVHTDEPQATGPAADHSTATRAGEPGGTGDPAGEHSRSGQGGGERRPGNPVERRDDLRSRYRAVLDHTLALPKTP